MSAELPWAQRHIEKWERVNGSIRGLQFIHVDAKSFELRVSLPGFEEGLVVGRPERRYAVPPSQSEIDRAVQLKLQPPQWREVYEPAVDVSDEDIDRVLACWREGKSAAGLHGVKSIPAPAPAPRGGGWPAM